MFKSGTTKTLSLIVSVEPYWNLNVIIYSLALVIGFVSVEPYWNLNNIETLNKIAIALSISRTILEFKFLGGAIC